MPDDKESMPKSPFLVVLGIKPNALIKPNSIKPPAA